jgi:hypothetical protein
LLLLLRHEELLLSQPLKHLGRRPFAGYDPGQSAALQLLLLWHTW